MSDQGTMRALGIGGAVFAGLSLLTFAFAMGFDPMAGAEFVERVVETDSGDADWIRWGAVTDMVGYYFLPAALMVFLRNRLPWRSPLSDIATLGGLAYAVVGAAGAGVLAAAAPTLIEGGDGDALETVARTVQGMWQWFEPIPFGLWALGVALALRPKQSAFSRLFFVIAGGAALVLIGLLIEVEVVLAIGLTIWLGLFPVALATVGMWGARPD
jgi:hypothetical protein